MDKAIASVPIRSQVSVFEVFMETKQKVKVASGCFGGVY